MKSLCLTLSLLAAGFTCSAFGDDVIKDDFSGESLSGSWAAVKGDWKIEDGMLSGAELESDKHAAVLNYSAPHNSNDGEIKFQLNGSKEFHLSFNHPKGHLYRVIVKEDGVSLRTDKDKKDPASKAINLETVKGAFEQGKTYTMRFKVADGTATAEFDNGLKVTGTHELLKKKKTGYRLIIKGDGVLFDDFIIHSQG
ncbi:MAG: hypothetical protein P1U86_02335 [Verrucomicrobiales bacterium]|nr:hypothetical protein [Verrucomicrobiales bacterium]